MNTSEKLILRAIEEAYRLGLKDARGSKDIEPFLLTSQVVAHKVANEFCTPLFIDDGTSNFIVEKIEGWVKMINSGFSFEQIQTEVWNYISREGIGILRIESMIFNSMALYAEIIKRSSK